MITLLWPCKGFYITDDWSEHIARAGYPKAYAGTDLASYPQPLRPSQFNGLVTQAMYDKSYGYTTFVKYSDDTGPVMLIRNAHQSSLGVQVGDIVSPQHSLGILGSTGNSTGNHTHFEVWLNLPTGWQNIDPLDPKYDIRFVSDPANLVPLSGGVEMPKPEFKIPDIGTLPLVTPSSYVTSSVRLHNFPSVPALTTGRVLPGEKWEMFAAHIDVLGNIWFGVRKGFKVGWAAGVHNGIQLLVEITQQ